MTTEENATTEKKVLGAPPQLQKIMVTEDIIESASKRNSNHCMIAEAIKAAYPKLSMVAVDAQTIRATNAAKGERYIWLTPRKAQEAIIDFDRGERVKPFRIYLRMGQTIPSGTKNGPRYRKPTMKTAKDAESTVPNIIGGHVPKRALGARRAFGMRALKY